LATVAKKAKRKLTDVYIGQADTILPTIGDLTYDWIIMADSFEHLVNPWKTMNEITRILKPSGHLALSITNVRNINIIMDLFFRGRWNYAPAGILDRGHVRFFTMHLYKRFYSIIISK
jgi:ubiquinone/menaquinone biosynthesis C-methylase UbiE